MKIKTVRATAVSVPVTRIAAFSKRKLTHVANTIVEIETVDGTVGLGETRGDWCARVINEMFAPKLTGLPVTDHRAAIDICLPNQPFDYGYPEYPYWRNAFAGIEIALWDLAAKAAGQPLFDLLGGSVRERAPFVAYAYTVDPDEGTPESEIPGVMADIAAASLAESGAGMFEFKVGLHSVDCEIAVVRAVRDAVGAHIELAVDANMAFTVEQARRFLAGVAPARLANIEEPVAGLGAMARLREDFGVPVSTHCIDLDAIRAHPAIDSVVSDPALLGGVGPLLEFIARVGAIDRRFWLRARWELGIAWALMCHIGVARPELDRPAQALINWVEDDLIEGEPWLVRDGGVRPPDVAGLGVDIDRAALDRYKQVG